MENKIALELLHKKNNGRNSEGAFATLNDQRIVFIYSHYGEGWDDGDAAKLCARYSSDQGRTWTPEDVLVLENEGKCNIMSVSLLRLSNGKLGMWYIRKDEIDDARTYLRISEDDETWGVSTLCVPAPGYFVLNNDRVIQLKGGRLVAPMALHRNPLDPNVVSDNIYASLDMRGIVFWFLSDDNGKSWREAKDWWALPVRSGSGLQEPGVVELADGRLYCYCRTSVGCQYEMYSEDMGETWSAPVPSVFMSPESPMSIKRLPQTGDLLAVWNDHSGKLIDVSTDPNLLLKSWGRTPLACAISSDEGRSWKHHKLLETDLDRGFCYIAIHPVDDAVLLSYCCGGAGKSIVLQDLCIRRIDMDWLYSESS